MWLRHALRLSLFIFLFSACSPTDRQAVDKLNSLSYAYHYSNLDSTAYYAQQAYDQAAAYSDGRAEALNNLAFVRIARMEYDEARKLLDEVAKITDNQLEQLIAYIMQMRLCQRMSSNRAFYDYREQAIHALRRIEEERSSLTAQQQLRLIYAESELAIVTSTYYYYVGLERQAASALYAQPADLQRDTAQYLNYLYNVGSGGMLLSGTQEEINQIEFDHLMRCYLLSREVGNVYFAANSLEALAEHLMTAEYRKKLISDNLPAFKYFNPDGVSNDSLPMNLAGRSLEMFLEYGDVYQIAGAHRTLASCYLQDENYEQALMHLHMALEDTIISKAPDLVASIREQLSVAYAAIDDKQNSDQNRNIYLDLQEQTRQDRSLEARAGQLEQEARQLNGLIWAVLAAIIVLVFLVVAFYLHRLKHGGAGDMELQLREDELKEKLAMARLRVERGERLALEQRAKISLVNGITPLIDRILHETSRLDKQSADEQEKRERLQYISELTDNINEQNDVLTHWIQLRKGELSLHIETFPLQQLFDIVNMGRSSFGMKHITLEVVPTASSVKADKVLTLFMLNTLADNARKFTPEGGQVKISAQEKEQYVEITVSDTGIGMDEQQLSRLFSVKNIDHADAPLQPAAGSQQKEPSHGFGLLNCKGIIEKYRKTSSLFSVCMLSAESQVGKGSRFFFRLPKGVLRTMLLWVLFACIPVGMLADVTSLRSQASAYADSAYFSNINGTYERTLLFADSCRRSLNAFYRQHFPSGADTLLSLGDLSVIPPEIKWFHDSLKINFNILLTIRNESAVAALALHQWQLYQYNNRIYTQLFKEMSADATLDDYCRKMQHAQTNRQVAIILLVVLLLSILVAVAWQVMASMGRAARRQQELQERQELAADEIARVEMEEGALHVSNAVLDNCLSTLKHETMYYPSRIRQLVDANDEGSLAEVAAYYRELYGILSLQASRQTEHARLHLKPLDHDLLGDPVLIGYLFELLRKQSGEKKLDISYQAKDDKYVVCTVAMPQLKLTEQQASALFTPSTENIPYLLCRQIVRDHGEATNRRGCAIRAEIVNHQTQIIITLPRIWNHSKSLS